MSIKPSSKYYFILNNISVTSYEDLTNLNLITYNFSGENIELKLSSKYFHLYIILNQSHLKRQVPHDSVDQYFTSLKSSLINQKIDKS